MRKLAVINVCLLLLLVLLISLVVTRNPAAKKAALKIPHTVNRDFVTPSPASVIKVDAKKHGLNAVTYTLPDSFTVDGIPIEIRRKTLVYPTRLPVLTIKSDRPGIKSVTLWFGAKTTASLGQDKHDVICLDREGASRSFAQVSWTVTGSENGTVTIKNSGAVTFTRSPIEHASFDEQTWSRSTLENKAARYVRMHGGAIKDVQIFSMGIQTIRGGTKSLGRASTLGGYTQENTGPPHSQADVGYRHFYKGVRIYDDQIYVQFNHGVSEYWRSWHEFTPGVEQNILNPRQAIEYAVRAKELLIKKNESILPYSMQIMYFDPRNHSLNSSSGSRELRPGWVMGLANRPGYLIVDAINGELYDLDPLSLNGFCIPELYWLY